VEHTKKPQSNEITKNMPKTDLINFGIEIFIFIVFFSFLVGNCSPETRFFGENGFLSLDFGYSRLQSAFFDLA
jgi:hypothetical protein